VVVVVVSVVVGVVAPSLNAISTGGLPSPTGKIIVSPATAGHPFIPPGA
jgi:hypothetical protein